MIWMTAGRRHYGAATSVIASVRHGDRSHSIVGSIGADLLSNLCPFPDTYSLADAQIIVNKRVGLLEIC